MTHPLLRTFLRLIGLFYPWIAVSHRERLPASGPVLLIANHPNGLLDPLVVRQGLGVPVRFLGKSTFWDNPVGAWTMNAAGALPVYRAREADTARNEETFAACRKILADRGWLALFPEGTTHSAPTLLPLKTGAARIAFGAEVEGGWQLGLKVVPVGMLYEDKTIFRSRVSLVVGPPIPVAPLRAAYEADPRAAVDLLTDQMAAGLGDVVLQAANDELWRGLVAVASWTASDGGADVAARDRRALALAARVRTIGASDPDRLAAAVAATRRFVEVLTSLGVRDPLAVAEPDLGLVSSLNLGLVLRAPFALVGAILAWVPYRLVRPLAAKLSGGHDDVVGTYKMLAGLFVLGLTYVGWTVAAGLAGGWLAALAMAVVGPWTGLVALQFQERMLRRREALVGWWVATDEARRTVVTARAELCRLVEAALAEPVG
jgi:glycerol-3-phosphate O-acyltransferase/dihydroxyacetone phosphate acyltransferase